MDEATAKAEIERLRREDPDRAHFDWIAQPLGDPAGEWRIVKVGLPDGVVRAFQGPHGTLTEPAEEPPPPDPRSAMERNLGGPYTGGV